MSQDVTIYGLTDPRTGHIRYIGQSLNPDTRWKSHCASASSNEAIQKSNWIKELKEAGMKPQLLELEKVAVEDANSSELFYIEYFKMLGANLTNGSHYIRYSQNTRIANAARPAKKTLALSLPRDLRVVISEMAITERRSMSNEIVVLIKRALEARGK
jgi:hypothetical protein